MIRRRVPVLPPVAMAVALIVLAACSSDGGGKTINANNTGPGNSSNAAKTAPLALCNSLDTAETEVDNAVTADRDNGAASSAAVQTAITQLTPLVQPIVTQAEQSVPSTKSAGDAFTESLNTLNAALAANAPASQISADIKALSNKWFDFTNAVSKHCPGKGF